MAEAMAMAAETATEAGTAKATAMGAVTAMAAETGVGTARVTAMVAPATAEVAQAVAKGLAVRPVPAVLVARAAVIPGPGAAPRRALAAQAGVKDPAVAATAARPVQPVPGTRE